MAKRPKSEALAAIHETMQGLHSVGAIDDTRMRHYDETCLETDADAQPKLTFEVYKDKYGEWRWRLLAAKGRVIATAGEGYKSRKQCLAGIALVRTAGDAKVAA